MSKRKSKSPHKLGAVTPDVAKSTATPKRSVSAADLSRLEEEELQAAPESETKVPEVPDQDTETKLSPVPPPDLQSKPSLPPHLAGLKPDVAALPIGARAEAKGSAPTVIAEARTAGPLSEMDGLRRAIAGIEACQTLFLEATLGNLNFAASLASMRSPFEILGVATKFAVGRIGMYGKFSKAVADIAAGRQAS
jgi:hypothetical protein